MDDKQILERISALVDEEHRILGDGEADTTRLKDLQATLDQCWDLLRQRRALREFDQDPDQAQVRKKSTVENYQQ